MFFNRGSIKKRAFTLAEVLITLVIIGVIAALTIPTLMGSYMHKICAAQLKKVVGEITNAAQTIIAEEKADEENTANNVDIEEDANEQQGFYFTRAGSSTSNQNEGAQYFLKNFIKNNSITSRGTLFANKYKNSTGTEIDTIPADYRACVQTQSGAGICMQYHNATQHQRIFVDVNGRQKPNIIGVDLFVMQITDSGSVEDINPNNANNCGTGNDITTATTGCLKRVIDNGWIID